ncbi:penicillin-insensitive murein endopeptidase [Cognatiyoonia sp. IB215182]|uniref:penicillin-insensitive murein endopeptidase n=1 Tax=Cognatiyoonia sp. IB215182 TaxID=3097353 RepID=UPI002A15B46C|nr:penicillin-insensitive murein endopeptidase [Cognatiyoonia sp. IB215182]MDX8352577.1 penicillin-insensitive murein endopeptidase [Cognatiyoonia sp. IB215182]
MVRYITAFVTALALAACQAEEPQVSLASQNINDTRVAKPLFEAVTTATSQPPQAVGGYSRGCQAGGQQLAETGPTWQAMRLSRNRNWSQPITIDFVQDLSRFAATQPGWEGLYVGDLSLPRGGPVSGHASHQSGLDVDIWMLPPDRLNLTVAERESISSISMRRSAGAFTNSSWTPEHEAIMRAAASDPRVSRIFVFPGAKVSMCNNATGDRSWLSKIRPWWGHHYHFHVRLNCPSDAATCVDQTPPPPGDGCAEAQGWVDRILNPPPPDPNAPPPTPRAELTMANLPGQCLAVLNAN